MDKTMAECIKCVKAWKCKNGTSEALEILLHTMEHEGILRLDLVPEEIFHDLSEGNVSPIPMDMILKLQAFNPWYDWVVLSKRGEAILESPAPLLTGHQEATPSPRWLPSAAERATRLGVYLIIDRENKGNIIETA